MTWTRNISLIFISFTATIGGLIFGLMLAWSAPAASEMINNENYQFDISPKAFGWVTGFMALGGFFGAPLAGYVRSIIGTKKTIIIFCLPIIIGQILIIFAMNIVMLLIGRFLNGLSASCFAILNPIYVGEISPSDIRGRLLSIFQMNLNLGTVLIFIIGYFSNMAAINIFCAVIPIIYAGLFFILPDSGDMIDKRGCCSEKNELKRLRKTSKDDKSKVQSEMKFKEILNDRATFKALIIILMLFMFLQMSGMNVVLYYATLIFEEAGVNINPGLSSIIISCLGLIATFLTIGVVDKFGRKFLLLISFVLVFLGLAGIGTFFKLKDFGVDTSKFEWLPLASLCLYMLSFNFRIASVTFTLLGEIFKDEAKKFVAPMGLMVNFSLSFILGFTFPIFIDGIGMGFTFYIFGIFAFLGMFYTIFNVPETKGKTFDEIVKILN